MTLTVAKSMTGIKRPMAYRQMPGDVQSDEEGLETMRNLGLNMAYLLKALDERRW